MQIKYMYIHVCIYIRRSKLSHFCHGLRLARSRDSFSYGVGLACLRCRWPANRRRRRPSLVALPRASSPHSPQGPPPTPRHSDALLVGRVGALCPCAACSLHCTEWPDFSPRDCREPERRGVGVQCPELPACARAINQVSSFYGNIQWRRRLLRRGHGPQAYRSPAPLARGACILCQDR